MAEDSKILNALNNLKGGSENNETFLSRLVGAGADAQINLYIASFTLVDTAKNTSNSSTLSNFSVRLKNYTTPRVGVQTIKLPYQNTIVEKILPSANIDKTTKFNIRIDNNYYIYKLLQEYSAVGPNGELRDITDNAWNISVSLYKDLSDISLSAVETWSYETCHIIDVGSITYGYDSSGPVYCPVSFVYKKLSRL